MLLDTYAWIEFFNGTDKGLKVKNILKQSQCFTSSISIAELGEWAEKEHLDGKKIFESVKKLSTVIGLDEETLWLAGALKVRKRKTVKNFGLVDAIILSTAKQYKLPVVTGDKHFSGETVVML